MVLGFGALKHTVVPVHAVCPSSQKYFKTRFFNSAWTFRHDAESLGENLYIQVCCIMYHRNLQERSSISQTFCMQYSGISGRLNFFFWSCAGYLKYYLGGKVIEVFNEMR